MFKHLLYTSIFMFAITWGYSQVCVNNPSIQQGDINPAPLPWNGGGIAQLSYFENLLDYTDEENDPITITFCLLNITPVNGAASVSGSFAGTFNWLYDPTSNCLQGTQNQDILGGTGGLISVAFNSNITTIVYCPDNQMGFNANLQPAACMNGINETVDDTESVYTCVDPDFPIELSSFTGVAEECNGIINWTTQSEINFSHFELEKSIDGVSFSTIETIQGKGNPGAAYSFVDTKLRTINYYRLKSVDEDGTISYSKIIFIDKGKGCSEADIEFEIYPNPVINTDLTVSVDSKFRNQEVNLAITDALGRVLIDIPTTLLRGGNIIEIPVDKLANGTYFIGIKGADIDKDIKKFVKLSN